MTDPGRSDDPGPMTPLPSAADWDTIFEGQGWGRWPHEGLVRAFCRLAAERPGLKVLDAGCGPGANLIFLEREGHGAFGIDLSEVALAQAEERLTAAGFVPRLMLGSVTDLPFPDRSFDVVVEVEVLTYVVARDVAWAEMARVLRPSGKVVSVAFGRRSDPALMPYLRNCQPLEAGEIAALAVSAGLVPIEQQVQMRTEGPEHLWIEEIITVAAKS